MKEYFENKKNVNDCREVVLPVTPEGVVEFLAGEFVKGIGKVYARRLVEAYGTDVIERLRDDPAGITGVAGLGQSRIEAASQSLRELKYPLDLLLFLCSAGVLELYITRIFGKYRSRTRDVITGDPYSMVEDVWRLSFFTADRIGRLLGIPADDPRRLCGALLTAVKHYAEAGHLYAMPDQAVAYASEITGVEPDKVAAVIPRLIEEERLVESLSGLYLPVFYEAEREGAERLIALASAPVTEVDPAEIPVSDMAGHIYSPTQREAIRMALEHPVTILTGGPGSGKTTVLKGILDVLDDEDKTYILAAPTGRAAKRMSTLTGRDATTIHRLLGYRQGEGYFNKTIDTDVLVIDEGSMLEQVLLNHLLKAVRPGTKIIIVGDIDQLPAIGAGDVMRELIRSHTVPVITLSENFRQAAGSRIVTNARAINRGEIPEDQSSEEEREEFLLVPESGVRAIHDRILSLVAAELPARLGISPFAIQVVTPQQLGALGARSLNVDLQQRINPAGPFLRRGATLFRLGDPVMQTSNSRDRDLYNGETGHVVEVNEQEQSLVVEFAGGRRSTYPRGTLGELTLAYATSVHKLQGSEVDYMVMPVAMAHRPMLYRNLLYTAVSRARRLCVLVGEEDAIRYAVDNLHPVRRNSNFCTRLQTAARDSRHKDL